MIGKWSGNDGLKAKGAAVPNHGSPLIQFRFESFVRFESNASQAEMRLCLRIS